MSRFPANLKYTQDHEWAKVEGNKVTVGITDHAQSALGDVVFVELPAVGKSLKKGETFGVVESIKAVSDLYSPITGKIIEVNSKLPDDPGAINRDPHADAWIVKMEVTDPASMSDLMDAAAYEKFVAALK
jgi:glycine cleavage system H protein